MAGDLFIKIDGIDGESTDDKHAKWIEPESFSFGAVQPGNVRASALGGAGIERVEHNDLSFSKLIDSASPKIYDACCKGTISKTVTIEAWRAGGEKTKYMEIKLEQVLITSYSLGGGSGGFPSESITMNFGKITLTYFQQKRDSGGASGQVMAGWDLVGNKAVG